MKVFFALTTAIVTISTSLPLVVEASPAQSATVDRSAANTAVRLARRSCGARRFSRPRYYRYW